MFSKLATFGAACALAVSFAVSAEIRQGYDYEYGYGHAPAYKPARHEKSSTYGSTAPSYNQPAMYTPAYTEASTTTQYHTEAPTRTSVPSNYGTEASTATTSYMTTDASTPRASYATTEIPNRTSVPSSYGTEASKSSTSYMTTEAPNRTTSYASTVSQKRTMSYVTTEATNPTTVTSNYSTEAPKHTASYKTTEAPKHTIYYATTEAPKGTSSYSTTETAKSTTSYVTIGTSSPTTVASSSGTAYKSPSSTQPPNFKTEAPRTTENTIVKTMQPPKYYTTSQEYARYNKLASNSNCGDTCRFTFCEDGVKVDRSKFSIGGSYDEAFTPPICDKHNKIKIGSVDHTGEAYVVDKNGKTLISHFVPNGLHQPFSKSFFKSYYIADKEKSGVGHENAKKSQLALLDDKCIVLPLAAYQILDDNYVIDEAHPTSNPFYYCVAFEAEFKPTGY